MKVLREFNGIELNEGNLMASGLYNLSTDNDLSNWFDTETKDELMEATDEEFETLAKDLLK